MKKAFLNLQIVGFFFPLVIVCWGFLKSSRMWFERERSQGTGTELSEPDTAEIPLAPLNCSEMSLYFTVHELCSWLPFPSCSLPKVSGLCPLGALHCFNLDLSVAWFFFLLFLSFFLFLFLSLALNVTLIFPLSLCLMREEIYGLFTSGSLAFPDVLLL